MTRAVAALLATFRCSFLVLALTVSPAFAQLDLLSGMDDPYPLRAADTSSPRDTLRSFVRDFGEAIEALRADGARADAMRPLLRASDTLDFSEVRLLGREATMLIDMALLREVLDRVELPQYEDIPGDAEVATDPRLLRYVIPSTKLEIVKIEAGPRAGQFLFSGETVREIRRYYQLAKSLPYKSGALVGVYEWLLASPGAWLPKSFPESLPGWARSVVAGQGVWQWIALALLIGVAMTVTGALYHLGSRWDEGAAVHRPLMRFGVPVALLAIAAVATAVGQLAEQLIGLLELPLEVVALCVLVVQVASLSSLAVVASGRLADALGFRAARPGRRQRLDAAFMRIVFRLVSVVCLVVLGVFSAEAIGIPITPLVAGLGVGGLAIALAIRPTLENVIGGLTLFADRPVRVGDFCRYGNNLGTVEQIGLRSTRIRSLERSIVTIPNAEFSQMHVDNLEMRDRRLLNTRLQLRYETTPEQMRYLLAKLRELLLAHPMVTAEPARVRLVGFGAYSKDLEVFAYLRCRTQDQFLAVQEDLLLRMEDLIKEAGTEFAFPSQTTYLTRATGLNGERQAESERQVMAWRAQGKLPFPDFEQAEGERLKDTLDYPPAGSPDHKPREEVAKPAPGGG